MYVFISLSTGNTSHTHNAFNLKKEIPWFLKRVLQFKKYLTGFNINSKFNILVQTS